MLKDPVCGKRISRNHAHIAFDYQAMTYYLCCPRCQADFEQAPEKFAKPEFGEKTSKHTHAKHNAGEHKTPTGLTIVQGPRG